MHLDNVTFTGSRIDDEELLVRLPSNLAGLLRQVNGFIQFHGGLHVRGACREPTWHSLRDAWDGKFAFHRLYSAVRSDDIPFAEDCMGDQFLLRDRRICTLCAETGEIESLGLGLREFFDAVAEDPVEFLSMHPLPQYQQDGGNLQPGQLLSGFPPFCIKESENGVALRAVDAEDRRRFLASLANKLRDVPDGEKVDFRIVD